MKLHKFLTVMLFLLGFSFNVQAMEKDEPTNQYNALIAGEHLRSAKPNITSYLRFLPNELFKELLYFADRHRAIRFWLLQQKRLQENPNYKTIKYLELDREKLSLFLQQTNMNFIVMTSTARKQNFRATCKGCKLMISNGGETFLCPQNESLKIWDMSNGAYLKTLNQSDEFTKIDLAFLGIKTFSHATYQFLICNSLDKAIHALNLVDEQVEKELMDSLNSDKLHILEAAFECWENKKPLRLYENNQMQEFCQLTGTIQRTICWTIKVLESELKPFGLSQSAWFATLQLAADLVLSLK